MKALLIVDIQNDYFAGGNEELVNPDAALANAENLLNQFRESCLPIIHVKHINVVEGVSFFLSDTDGAIIHQRLTPKQGEHLVVKNYPNIFHQTICLTSSKAIILRSSLYVV